MSRSALITGVTGYIGGKLAERLVADGWQVAALVRPSSDLAELPVGVTAHRLDDRPESLTDILTEVRPDIIFHLASLYLADHRPDQVDALVESNILFPARLAEAMSAAGVTRLVNTGTAWQHFESDGYRPVNLYAATKQACMDILRYYQDARRLSLVTLKLFDTYGKGDKRRKLVQLLVDAAMAGTRLDMSPGEQVLDLTHVDDVVEAFVIAGERLLGAEDQLDEEYLVSGERFSLKEVIGIVSDALDRPIHANLGGRPYRPREVMMPVTPSPAQALPDWKRRHTLRDSIPDLIARGG